MSPDYLFSLAGQIVLLGWVCLLVSPFLPRISMWVSGRIIPFGLSALYAALILTHISESEGGFGSLEQVATLFSNDWVLLAGWVHYLAFDLFVGAWECKTARDENIPFWLVLPCLPLTFMFGPAGFLLFQAIRASRAATMNRGA